MLFFKIAALAVLAVSTQTLHAAVATVGIEGPGTKFTKLSDAVKFVNSNPVEPNIIYVKMNSTDNAQIEILVPMTIEGDSDQTGTSRQIGVDCGRLVSQGNLGSFNISYIEIKTSNTVNINNLTIYPTIDASNVYAIQLYNPSAGMGNYNLTNVKVGGTRNGNFIPATDPKPFQNVTTYWSKSIVNVTETPAGGGYNSTLTDCHLNSAYDHCLRVTNKTGKTHIIGGILSGASKDVVKLEECTGVSLMGTETNRLQIRESSFNSCLTLVNNAVVDEVSYVDIIEGSTASISITNSTITHVSRVRTSAYQGILLNGGSINIFDSTFHSRANPPLQVSDGIASVKDSIFTSEQLGSIHVSGGLVVLDYCALPKDGYTKESLRVTSPVVGSVNMSNIVSTSPRYSTAAFDILDKSNYLFLRPTHDSYVGASSAGRFLGGGAGDNRASVTDWSCY